VKIKYRLQMLVCSNEAEFISSLSYIFNSSEFADVMRSLLALSNG
jgi:hypothetical protein